MHIRRRVRDLTIPGTRAQDGFTLIELLVVIIILGILAAVVVFSVSGINNTGQEAACEIDTRTLRTAMEARYADEGGYGNGALTDWDGSGQAVGVDIDETSVVGDGFLSEVSVLHDIEIVDIDPTTGADGVNAGVRIVMSSSPPAECGVAGGVAGNCGAFNVGTAAVLPDSSGNCASGSLNR